MFEMFALLINFNHLWRNDYSLLVFCLSYLWSSPTQRMLHTIFYITYSRICRGNLSREFAVTIYRENLPQEFALEICRGYLGFFVFVSTFFFVYVINSCLYGSKPFLYVSKTFLFVRFSLLPMFLFVIAVAVMGHRTTKVRLFHFEKMFLTETGTRRSSNWTNFWEIFGGG